MLGIRLAVWPSDRLKALLWGLGLIGGVEGLRALAIYNEVDLGKYRMVLFALVLIVIMIQRPGGLFGTHEINDLVRMRRKAAAHAGEEVPT
ncbi:MAG: hypothetical protein QM754_03980 [Tepidisphaeraceae bacterium]